MLIVIYGPGSCCIIVPGGSDDLKLIANQPMQLAYRSAIKIGKDRRKALTINSFISTGISSCHQKNRRQERQSLRQNSATCSTWDPQNRSKPSDTKLIRLIRN